MSDRIREKPCPVCAGSGVITVPVGERLKNVRETAGLTQDAFAKSLGISRPSLANIEAGRQDVPTHQLVIVNRVYGTSVDWLLGLEAAQ